MKRIWEIIPEYDSLKESVELAEKYGAVFEYNDFFLPEIYEDTLEVEKRIKEYKSLSRDRSNDTLHGVFFDIAMSSRDSIIRERSRFLMEQSMDIAGRLGCRGVVFHTGILANLWMEPYLSTWVKNATEYISTLAGKYADIDIYMENTFERDAKPLVDLMKEMNAFPNVKLCLDYAHASLAKTPIEEWIADMLPYLGHMHTNDNDLKNDLHGIPGRGQIDYRQFKELINKYKIDVPILLELNGIEAQREALEFVSNL